MSAEGAASEFDGSLLLQWHLQEKSFIFGFYFQLVFSKFENSSVV